MAKITGKKKVRTRKRPKVKQVKALSAQQVTAQNSIEKIAHDKEPMQELAQLDDSIALEEFFTTNQDAAINRFADAASNLVEHQEQKDKSSFLSCLLGGEEYGIDLSMAREILRPITLTPVPHAPEAVLGVMSLRGQVMPVIDLAMHIGLVKQKLPEKPGQRYIVLSYAGELLCFRVDSVDGVVSFDEAGIEPPPQDLHGQGREYVFGIGRAGHDRMLLLLDLDLLVGQLLPGEL